MAPPPMTTRRRGASVTRITSRLVQYGVSARPSIGGTRGSVPVLRTHAARRDVARVAPSPSTRTTPGPASRPCPRTNRDPGLPPAARRAGLSSQSWLARRGSGSRPGPVRPDLGVAGQRVDAPRLGEQVGGRIIILEGMQP